MTMTEYEAEEEASTWRDLLVRLQDAISSSERKDDDGDDDDDGDGGGGGNGDEKVLALSRRFIDGDFGTSDDGGGGHDNDVDVPEDVLRTVRTVHLRCLIRQSKFIEVVKLCEEWRGGEKKEGDDEAPHRMEEGYALYRLGRYKDARNATGASSARRGPVGLEHVLAQSLYRLGETRGAMEVYGSILGGSGGGAESKLDDDDDDEVLANYLAAASSNRTYTGAPLTGVESDVVQRATALLDRAKEKDAEKKSEEAIVGGGGKGARSEYNYDLACNLASLLLQASTSMSTSYARLDPSAALAMLADAERGCVASSSGNFALLASEVAPIRAQRSCGLWMTGDVPGAMKLWRGLASMGGKAGEGARVAALANLAVLEDGVGVGGGGGGILPIAELLASAKPTALTPSLVRSALYGEALASLRRGDVELCRAALVDLRTALDGGGGGGGKRKKKGKASSALPGGGGGSGGSSAVSRTPPPAASASSPEEARLWLNRVAMVDSALLRNEGKAREADDVLDDALARTRALLSSSRSSGRGGEGRGGGGPSSTVQAASFGVAELLLYKAAAVADGGGGEGGGETVPSPRSTLDVLESLPGDVRSRPAIRGALAALYASTGGYESAQKVLEDDDGGGGGGDREGRIRARVALADLLLRRGEHEAAADRFRGLLRDVGGANDDDDGDGFRSEIAASLIRALSFCDPRAAVDVARKELPELLEEGGEVGGKKNGYGIDVDELEAREMPRISTGASRSRNRLVGTSDGASQGKNKRKKSRDAIMRRRARKREAHLKKLEAEGRIKPGAWKDNPPKPDPERWIPKPQRSYSRRGRKGRGRFVGPQGTGGGAERDAAKLDAAARAAAAAAAKAEGGGHAGASSQPSTAHMEVAGSGVVVRRKGGRR